ncbi:uncharacterized protein PITG_07170 [Phytophthora infestans T30-4]|uniref:Uncharacterized protein n=1 Tax=Phytophthora infestans (strain T30-4) TaxID=403677 RepID=D0N7G1_PHYIT|nr:uncharacterized protein PITG_07170 [Phytophthora infestans T30-4]EEY53510.1 conserved hypothetical protein [Phytophthora infestans T30-4]|eukprot:XP_002905128.1 conserved hypothetical protein [Phytophthora infestans T30-4]
MSGPGYRLDSDGDVEMSIPQPIFEVIRAPELSSWDHAALIEWYREWERYVEKIRHRCATTGETFENKPLASVTDADIMNAVKARRHTLKNEFVPDVTSLFRQKLKMDLSVDDCDARVFRYYEDFDGISEAGYKSRVKARCRILVDNLQPSVLKAQITRLIDLERRDCRSDDVALFDLILEHAKVQQRFHRLSHDYAMKADTKVGRPAERKSQRPGTVTPAI